MSLIAWPTGVTPAQFSLRLATVQRAFGAPSGGSEQVVDLLNDRWVASLTLSARAGFDRGAQIEAFIAAMRGQTNTVNLWHFVRPSVRGTLGSATASAASQGASAVTLSGTGTLKAGDMLGISGLLLQVAADVTLAGSGSVSLVNRLRTAVSGTVTLTKPTAAFRFADPNVGLSYAPGQSEPVTLDFVEAVT
jgi:hypothetical protein